MEANTFMMPIGGKSILRSTGGEDVEGVWCRVAGEKQVHSLVSVAHGTGRLS